jgi:hypothetical protein
MVRPEGSLPEPHPDPPANLASWNLPITRTHRTWVRSHQRHHAPLFFGRTGRSRFDAPAGEYGVIYVAATIDGAFVETFIRDLQVYVIADSSLRLRRLTTVKVRRRLRLVDLRGSGLRQIGADARLWTGDYLVSRRWALALYQHPAQVDGLYYCSRHDPRQYCAAIFDRAQSALEDGDSVCLADQEHAALLGRLLETYGTDLAVGIL